MPLIRRIARSIGADRNPLRRPIDRFESTLRLLLVLTFVICGPMLAPATAHLSEVAGMQEVQREASWRQVDAVLLRPAPSRYYGYGSMATFWVAGRWRAPSGATREGIVPSRGGKRAGAKVRIWVDWAGRVTGRQPLTADMVQARSVLFGVGSVAGLAAALFILALLIRLMLHRRRMAYWGIEWACFGPRWTTRRWPRN